MRVVKLDFKIFDEYLEIWSFFTLGMFGSSRQIDLIILLLLTFSSKVSLSIKDLWRNYPLLYFYQNSIGRRLDAKRCFLKVESSDLLSCLFPKYGNTLTIYFMLISHANQNLIPNLSCLFGIYWVKRQWTLVENNCSSKVRFTPGKPL